MFNGSSSQVPVAPFAAEVSTRALDSKFNECPEVSTVPPSPPSRRIVPLALAYERRLLETLSADEQAKFGELLARLLDRSRRLGPAPDARV